MAYRAQVRLLQKCVFAISAIDWGDFRANERHSRTSRETNPGALASVLAWRCPDGRAGGLATPCGIQVSPDIPATPDFLEARARDRVVLALGYLQTQQTL
jgi:hypothetical protein